MANNRKTRRTAKAQARKAPAPRMSASVKAALPAVAPAALREGVARSAVVTAVRAAYSPASQGAVRDAYITGRIAAGLRRLGDNRDDAALLADGRAILEMAGKDAARVKDGQARRSPEQERLYGAARVAWHSILREADVRSTGKNAGNSNAKGNTRKRKAAPKAANSNRPASPRVKTVEELHKYYSVQAAAMLSTANKNAKLNSGTGAVLAMTRAVQAFDTAIKAIKL